MIARIEGTGLPLSGNDVDTDRIIPARFLVSVTFEGLERHLFEDDRKGAAAAGTLHPLDDPRFSGASILLVNRNFGCGSSREHALQAIHRWGIRAVVGESFSEIFFGNALALGLPCVTADGEALRRLQERAAKEPERRLTLDLRAKALSFGGETLPVHLPEGARDALLTGHWDGTALLLRDYDAVRAVASRLPYLSGFRDSA